MYDPHRTRDKERWIKYKINLAVCPTRILHGLQQSTCSTHSAGIQQPAQLSLLTFVSNIDELLFLLPSLFRLSIVEAKRDFCQR